MPLNRPDDFGTNAGGSRSGDYYRYCFKNGALLLEWCNTVTLDSVNAESCPRPVVLAKIAAQGYNKVWMATNGNVEIISNDATRQRLWQEWLAGFFPGGPAVPNYTPLRFVGRTAALRIDRELTHKDSI